MADKLSLIRALNRSSFESYGEDTSQAMQALNMATKLGDLASVAESKFIIGHCLVIRGRTRDATGWLHEARDLFASMPKDPVIRGLHSSLQIALALVCDDMGDHEGARWHCEQAHQMAQADGDAIAQQRALLYMGYAQYKLGRGELALDYMMDAVRHPAQHASLVYMAHDFLADLLEQQGLWAVVLRQRLKAVDHLSAQQTFRTARVRCGIARCLLGMGRLEDAWKSTLQADAAIAHVKEPIRVSGTICQAKAMYYLRTKNFEQAWRYQQQFAEHVESCGSVQYAQDALLLKAEIELEEGLRSQCQATFASLRQQHLSFHRRLALDVLQERLCVDSGDWSEAYKLHLQTEASQRIDLGMALERKEDIHRIELDALENKALIDKSRELERMGSERDDLMHLVVHDMANYLQVTRNSIEVVGRLIQEGAPKISISKDELVARSLSSLDMIEEVLGQLRLLWQVDSDPIGALALETVAIVPIVEQVVASYRQSALKKNQTLVLEVGDADIYCRVSPQHLNQILSNLISNAIKFSPARSETRVLIGKNPGGTLVRIHIEDQGQGMTAEDVSLAFQRFKRLSAKPTAGEPSNGLGLYLVKRMVEPMLGELSVRSPGKNLGAVFTLQLPVEKSSGIKLH